MCMHVNEPYCMHCKHNALVESVFYRQKTGEKKRR